MNPTANLFSRLEGLLGAARVLDSELESRKYAIAGRAPHAVVKPAQAEEVAAVVRFTAAEKLSVVCCGSRTKLEMGIPPQRYDVALDISGLVQIAHYDPADLTLSVDAGLPLAELSKLLAAQNQFLPLAVPCFDSSTIGGTVASGIDSTLRLQYGTARDLLIGAEFVDGTGRLCRSGGRVVKNVTGYDLHKLLIGSLGTLAAITRLNFRTHPLPEVRGGFVASFSSPDSALAFRRELLDSGLPFMGVELFDSQFGGLVSEKLKESNAPNNTLVPNEEWNVYAAFGGNEALVLRFQRELRERATQHSAIHAELLDDASNQEWSGVLQETFDWLRRAAPNVALLRIAKQYFTPADLAEFIGASSQADFRTALLLSGSGTALLALLCGNDEEPQRNALASSVAELFSCVNAARATATILYAPDWLKARCSVWGPLRPDFPLMQRVKASFDPQNIFSPGRFVGGL
jgi:glycolate oxidase FAD binding subunit